mgnify:CR=1 FL=1
MKKIPLLLALAWLMACQHGSQEREQNGQHQPAQPVQEKVFLSLGGEAQYVEMTGASADLPVLLFLHGGPGWPQTPHLRYFNAALTQEMILVSWDQAGAGQSYLRNPTPKNLSPESLVEDAHE